MWAGHRPPWRSVRLAQPAAPMKHNLTAQREESHCVSCGSMSTASSTYPPAFLTFIGMCGAFPVRWISVMNGSPRSNSGMRLRLLNCSSIHIRPGLPDSVFSSDATTAGVDDWPRTSDRRHIRAELYQLSYINALFGKTWQAALLSRCLFTAHVFASTSELRASRLASQTSRPFAGPCFSCNRLPHTGDFLKRFDAYTKWIPSTWVGICIHVL